MNPVPVQASKARLATQLLAQGVPVYYTLPAGLRASEVAQRALGPAQRAQQGKHEDATQAQKAEEREGRGGVLSLEQIDRVLREFVSHGYDWEEEVGAGAVMLTPTFLVLAAASLQAPECALAQQCTAFCVLAEAQPLMSPEVGSRPSRRGGQTAWLHIGDGTVCWAVAWFCYGEALWLVALWSSSGRPLACSKAAPF
jgi:hypothetical protein